jgi:hypothetical protein
MAVEKTIILGRRDLIVVSAGTPSDGDGAGQCPRGSICIAIGEGLMGGIYRNRGTKAWPVWHDWGTISGPIGRGGEP